MMLFQRRLLGELFRNAAGAWLLLSIVLMLGMVAAVAQKAEGLSLGTFVQVVPAMTIAQVDITLPLSVLVAVVLTFGRAAADNEVDALRCSGVHPLQIGLPGLVFGALTGVLLLLCMDYVKPWSETAKRRFLDQVDYASVFRARLSAGEPVNLDDRTLITADRIATDGRALGVRVQLSAHDGQVEREIVAESADISVSRDPASITLVLRDFRTVRGPRAEGGSMEVTRSLPRGATALDLDQLTTPQLMADSRRVGSFAGFTAHDARLEVAMRLSSAAACLLFVLVGMPIAVLYRRGDRTGAFLAAFLIALFLYFPSRQISLYLAGRQLLPLSVATWSGSLLLLLIGLLLNRRVLLR
jgi:lipopolysaccharide export system permease protein